MQAELKKIFSRERPLFYFSLWNDTDRQGFKKFLDYSVQNNVFIVPPRGEIGTVWYNPIELQDIESRVVELVVPDGSVTKALMETLDAHWPHLHSFYTGKNQIINIEEFIRYYETLVSWWAAMTTVFELSNIEAVDASVQEIFAAYRAQSQEYTELSSNLMVNFWTKYFPEYVDIGWFIRPNEAAKIARAEMSETELESVRQRANGCVMINEHIYPMTELDRELERAGLVLVQAATNSVSEIQGRVAFPGNVRGPVKVVRTFGEIAKVQPGDILVAEMTTPNYFPVMKIAAAFVTDEGGITSHAAIVARELKKPCIIGTKIATRVLKDGDIVEVDAEKGIVKKIK